MAQLCGPLVPKISVCRNFLLRILDQRKKTGWFDILTSKTNFFFESLVLCSWFKPNSDWNKQWEIIYINQGILWLFEKSKSADLAWRKAVEPVWHALAYSFWVPFPQSLLGCSSKGLTPRVHCGLVEVRRCQKSPFQILGLMTMASLTTMLRWAIFT